MSATVQRRNLPARFRTFVLCALAAGLLAAALPAGAGAASRPNNGLGEQVYALTTNGQLLVVDAGTPGKVLERLRISGLARGEWLVGIDVRPATGDLYGIGSTSRVYWINTATGKATPVGGAFSPRLEGTSFGVDFNPTVDRIRLVSNTGQNLRLHPDTGAVVSVDGDLHYAPSDPNAATDPQVVASAYTNSVAGAMSTTLYNLEAARNLLVTQAPPNDGVLNTVAPLKVVNRNLVGFDGNALAGFDIVTMNGSDMAYVAIKGLSSHSTALYTLNLSTGQLATQGPIGRNDLVSDIAVAID